MEVADPTQRNRYVLVSVEAYEQLKPLFEDDPVTEEERLFHLREAGRRAGWDDPAMDVYNDLDPRRST
jgi:hypothetical protein